MTLSNRTLGLSGEEEEEEEGEEGLGERRQQRQQRVPAEEEAPRPLRRQTGQKEEEAQEAQITQAQLRPLGRVFRCACHTEEDVVGNSFQRCLIRLLLLLLLYWNEVIQFK